MNMVSRAGKLRLPLANESSGQSDLSANATPALTQEIRLSIWPPEIRLWWRASNHLRSQICVEVLVDDGDKTVAICMTRFF